MIGSVQMKPQRCQKRLPDIKRGGWTYSLLCDLPKGHEGECVPDDLEVLAEKVLPEIEKRYPMKAEIMSDGNGNAIVRSVLRKDFSSNDLREALSNMRELQGTVLEVDDAKPTS